MIKTCRCGGKTVDRKISIERTIGGRHIIFNNVPASVCPECNERYLASKTVKRMDRLLEKNLRNNEIEFEIDPKEQHLIHAFEIMQKKSIFSPKRTADTTLSLAELYLVADKIRREHSHV